MWTAITGLISAGIHSVTGYFERKQRIQEAVTRNRERMALDSQSHNQDWEMKQIENAGWKDDILFYGFIAMFVWAGFDPAGSQTFFTNLETLPDWFVQIWFWVVASVLGVKKLGDYVPGLIKGIKDAVSKPPM